jgi:hypothetical protein
MNSVERRRSIYPPQISHQPSVLSPQQEGRQLLTDAAVEPGGGGFPARSLLVPVAGDPGQALAPPRATASQVIQTGALADPPAALGRTPDARLAGKLGAGWSGSEWRQTQGALENKEFKRNAIDISLVFYKMSHFLANELFRVWPFIMLQMGGPLRERLVRADSTSTNLVAVAAAEG